MADQVDDLLARLLATERSLLDRATGITPGGFTIPDVQVRAPEPGGPPLPEPAAAPARPDAVAAMQKAAIQRLLQADKSVVRRIRAAEAVLVTTARQRDGTAPKGGS